jgi:hypothetical protein
MLDRTAWLNRLYAILDLNAQNGRRCSLGKSNELDSAEELDSPGIYFFFEQVETRQIDGRPRVVRVGIDGASLKTRLWQHRWKRDQSQFGYYVYTASVFRALEKGEPLQEFLPELNKYFAQIQEPLRAKMREFDKRVQGYLEGMHFTWVPVAKDLDPIEAPKNVRRFERKAIGLLSNFPRDGVTQIDPPSPSWLGRLLTKENLSQSKNLAGSKMASISESGLWLYQHVKELPTADWLDEFESLVGRLDKFPRH